MPKRLLMKRRPARNSRGSTFEAQQMVMRRQKVKRHTAVHFSVAQVPTDR
jgi:hypothetical protein